MTLPGFFRAAKLWDLVVINDGQLIAALEFKSQAGPSLGNNFNNRAEEAIRSAHDLRMAWRACKRRAFGTTGCCCRPGFRLPCRLPVMMLEPKPTIMYCMVMFAIAASLGVSLQGRIACIDPDEESCGVRAIAGAGMVYIAIISDHATRSPRPGCPQQPAPNPS